MSFSYQRVNQTLPPFLESIRLLNHGVLLSPEKSSDEQLLSFYLYNLPSVKSALKALDKEIEQREEIVYLESDGYATPETSPWVGDMKKTKELFEDALDSPLDTQECRT